MRCIVAICFLMAYVASIDLYTVQYATHQLEPFMMKTWWNASNAGIIIFFIIDETFGFETYLHKQFNHLCKYSLLLNILIVIFTCQSIITNPFMALYVLDGSVFIASVIILINGLRHDIFKK